MSKLEFSIGLADTQVDLIGELLLQVRDMNQRLDVLLQALPNPYAQPAPAPVEHPADNVTPFPEPVSAPAPAPVKEYTKDDVMACVRNLCKKGADVKERVAGIIGGFCPEGQKASVSNIDPAKYAEVMAALEGELNG